MMPRAVLLHPIRFYRDHRLTCARSSEYIDDELGVDARLRIEVHLRICPSCARLLASLRRTVRALALLRTSDSAGPEVHAGILARLRLEPDLDEDSTGYRTS